jgi:hypothetical protein
VWLAQYEANASNGVQKLGFERIIDLPAEPSHLDVDDVVDWGEARVFSPDISGQHLAGDGSVAVLDQVQQQVEFFLSQRQVCLGTSSPSHLHIEAQVRNTKGSHWSLGLFPTQERLYAGEQFGECKWFSQIIVSSSAQSLYPLVNLVVRSENQNADIEALFTNLLQNVEPSAARKIEIQQDQMGVETVSEKKAFLSGDGGLYLEAMR